MDQANKRQRRAATTTRAQQAFVVLLVLSLISVSAVLIAAFFVFSSLSVDGSSEPELIKGIIKDAMTAFSDSVK